MLKKYISVSKNTQCYVFSAVINSRCYEQCYFGYTMQEMRRMFREHCGLVGDKTVRFINR